MGNLRSMNAALSLLLGGIVGSFVAVGCSDDSPTDTAGEDGGGDSGTVGDDARAPTDAAPPDAGFDARPYDEPVECQVSPCVTAIAAVGGAHVCALLSDETIRCWGDNRSGQLGSVDSSESYRATPTAVPGIRNATQISARGNDGGGTTCARLEDGTAMCWGGNDHAQLGSTAGDATPDSDAHPTPTRVAGIESVRRVDVGGTFACAISDSDGDHGVSRCWGSNADLQLGRERAATDYQGPDLVASGPVRFIRSAGTARNGFGLSDRADLFSWGGNTWSSWDSSQRDALGRESSLSPDGTPTMMGTLAEVTSVAASDVHACAISSGRVHCWGSNANGAVDPNSTRDSRWPIEVLLDGAKPTNVFVSHRGTCITSEAGKVHCWGDGEGGQLGARDAGAGAGPFAIPLPERAVQVAMMDEATCALLLDGAVSCWGSNTHGELGRGTADTDIHPEPALVGF